MRSCYIKVFAIYSCFLLLAVFMAYYTNRPGQRGAGVKNWRRLIFQGKCQPVTQKNWSRPQTNKIDNQGYIMNCENIQKYMLQYFFSTKYPELPSNYPENSTNTLKNWQNNPNTLYQATNQQNWYLELHDKLPKHNKIYLGIYFLIKASY